MLKKTLLVILFTALIFTFLKSSVFIVESEEATTIKKALVSREGSYTPETMKPAESASAAGGTTAKKAASGAKSETKAEEGLPDLAALSLKVNNDSGIVAQISNIAKYPLSGDGDVKVSFYYYYLNSDNVEVKEKICDKMVPKKDFNKNAAAVITFPTTTKIMSKKIEMVIDPDNEIKESDKSNNVKVKDVGTSKKDESDKGLDLTDGVKW